MEYDKKEWDAFKAAFYMAQDFYNDKISDGVNLWLILPDKAISNAFWKYINEKTDK